MTEERHMIVEGASDSAAEALRFAKLSSASLTLRDFHMLRVQAHTLALLALHAAEHPPDSDGVHPA